MSDDLKAQLAKACKTKSTADIADILMASSHAALIEDPQAVAAYLKSLAA